MSACSLAQKISQASLLSSKSFTSARSETSAARELIENLPLEYKLGEFICCHTIGHERVYRDTKVAVSGTYIIGHTHHAFDVKRDRSRIINCGSIGQNRRRLDRLNMRSSARRRMK